MSLFNNGRKLARQVIHLWVEEDVPMDRIAHQLRLNPLIVIQILEAWIAGNPPPSGKCAIINE